MLYYRLLCSKLHIAFEADGIKFHPKSNDEARDRWLWEHYYLPVMRLRSDELENESLQEILLNKIKDFVGKQDVIGNKSKYDKLGHVIKSHKSVPYTERMKDLWQNEEYKSKTLEGMKWRGKKKTS